MLLEDCLGDLDIPLNSIDILTDTLEELLLFDFCCYDEEDRIVLHKAAAIIFVLKLSIKHINSMQKKYNKIVKAEYKKLKS